MDEFACLLCAVITQPPPNITKSSTGLYQTQEKDKAGYPKVWSKQLIQLNPHHFHNVVGGSTWNFRIVLSLATDPSPPLVSHMTLNHINSLAFRTLNCETETQLPYRLVMVLNEIWV